MQFGYHEKCNDLHRHFHDRLSFSRAWSHCEKNISYEAFIYAVLTCQTHSRQTLSRVCFAFDCALFDEQPQKVGIFVIRLRCAHFMHSMNIHFEEYSFTNDLTKVI